MLAEAGVHGLPLFIAAALLLNITPGPDMLFVAGSAAARGRRAGVQAALGIGAGCLLHVALAAVGLSALLAASALAFGIVKWVGAAYLVWCGIGLLRARPTAVRPEVSKGPRDQQRSAFWQGALTNALNPKVALFFLAFLPQFIDPAGEHRAPGFVVLGLLFDLGGTLVNIAVALAAGWLREALATRAGARQLGLWLQRAVGAVFVGLGLRLAFSARSV
jgi:threonine/homoserine/homoserine lactone efflux protein